MREATVRHPICDSSNCVCHHKASIAAGTAPLLPVSPQQVTRISGRSQPTAAFPRLCETGALDEENHQGSLAAFQLRY